MGFSLLVEPYRSGYTSKNVTFFMRNQMRHFFLSQKYFTASSVFFALYGGVFFLNYSWHNSFLALIQMISGGFFLIFGTGISLTLLLQWVLKRIFDEWEFLSLSLLLGLLIPPLLLTVEFSLSGHVEYWYPLVNSLVLWSIAGLSLFLNQTSLPRFSFQDFSLTHPLTLMFLFGIFFILIEILSFPALPDLDPYKWLYKYTYQFANHLLDYSERPLFGSFIYIAITFMGVIIFDFFKYILPFFFLFTLFPAWMVARTFSEKKKQWIFLFFVFTTPNLLLYAGTAMPQMPFIILSYFFVFFLLYAELKQDNFFLYLAGANALLSFFYHETALILFLAWIIPVLIIKSKALLSDRKTLFFILLLIGSNLYRFQAPVDFALYWVKAILPKFFNASNFNFLYPFQYSNVDHNAMGWGSFGGVIKFYAFYVGPILGFTFLCLFFLLSQKKFRTFLSEQVRKSIALPILLLAFLFFFIIAEIFPRYPGISLLPDRSWIFCSILAYVFLYLVLSYVQRIPSKAITLFLFLFAVGISGTLYINSLKRYLLSPMQLESAEWIESHLPSNRIFLSYGYKNLLPVHAETPLIRIPARLYCQTDDEEFQKIMSDLNASSHHFVKQNFLKETYVPFLENVSATASASLQALENTSTSIDTKYSSALDTQSSLYSQISALTFPVAEDEIHIINPLSQVPLLVAPLPNENVYRFDSLPSLDNRPLYIYYSRLNTKNPYRDRPYSMESWGIEPCTEGGFLFDIYPDKFKRVYGKKNSTDEVIIWQVI